MGVNPKPEIIQNPSSPALQINRSKAGFPFADHVQGLAHAGYIGIFFGLHRDYSE